MLELDNRWVIGCTKEIHFSTSPIQYEDSSLGANTNRVDGIKLSRTVSVATKFTKVVHPSIHDHHSVVIQTIRYQDSTVGKKSNILRATKVSFIITQYSLLSICSEQFTAIVGKHINLVKSFIDQPNPALRIIWTNSNSMRSRTFGTHA